MTLPTKDFTKFSEDNPVLAWGAGGLGAAGGIWLFSKISNFLYAKFPSFASSRYFIPAVKLGTAIGLYFLSKVPSVQKIPFVAPAVFGAGVGLFGSAVADYLMGKASTVTGLLNNSENPSKISGTTAMVEDTTNTALFV